MVSLISILALATASLTMSVQAPAPSPEYREAISNFLDANWAKAEPFIAKHVIEKPDDGPAWYRLGLCHYNMGRYQEAVDDFGKAVKLQAFPPISLLLSACCENRLGHKEQAISALEQAVQNGLASANRLREEPDLKSLLKEPRMVTLMDRLDNPLRGVEASDAMDHWVGDWVVTGTQNNDPLTTRVPKGQRTAHNHIVKVLQGYGVQENWTDAFGGEGKSFFIFDQASKVWRQLWVSDTGWVVQKVGHQVKNGIEFEGKQLQRGGETMAKESLIAYSPDRVRQRGETSTDGGKTWTVSFDLTYVRTKAAKK
ncbi:MAG: tetratricopeptide repeat protein [Armatimonadetes bacterium]|nr:tetratricopeptide repeat protein [Armatimonadota bacterium]